VILVLGETKGHLGQSVYLREVEGREEGACPPVDLALEKKNGDFVRTIIEGGHSDTVHDVSDGGLLVAIAEMAMASGMGATIALPQGVEPIAFLFGEDQARYVMACPAHVAATTVELAARNGVVATRIGIAGGDKIIVEGIGAIALDRLKKAHEGWLPNYMAGEAN